MSGGVLSVTQPHTLPGWRVPGSVCVLSQRVGRRAGHQAGTGWACLFPPKRTEGKLTENGKVSKAPTWNKCKQLQGWGPERGCRVSFVAAARSQHPRWSGHTFVCPSCKKNTGILKECILGESTLSTNSSLEIVGLISKSNPAPQRMSRADSVVIKILAAH